MTFVPAKLNFYSCSGGFAIPVHKGPRRPPEHGETRYFSLYCLYSPSRSVLANLSSKNAS